MDNSPIEGGQKKIQTREELCDSINEMLADIQGGRYDLSQSINGELRNAGLIFFTNRIDQLQKLESIRPAEVADNHLFPSLTGTTSRGADFYMGTLTDGTSIPIIAKRIPVNNAYNESYAYAAILPTNLKALEVVLISESEESEFGYWLSIADRDYISLSNITSLSLQRISEDFIAYDKNDDAENEIDKKGELALNLIRYGLRILKRYHNMGIFHGDAASRNLIVNQTTYQGIACDFERSEIFTTGIPEDKIYEDNSRFIREMLHLIFITLTSVVDNLNVINHEKIERKKIELFNAIVDKIQSETGIDLNDFKR